MRSGAVNKSVQGEAGFTLVELMIVMTIIGILATIAIPSYIRAVNHAKEAVLREDLHTMRTAIDSYTVDKEKAPQSLDDLVSGGYIKAIPKDPMTGEANWEVVQEEVLLTVDQQDPGIDDVHSASTATSSDGSSAYNTW